MLDCKGDLDVKEDEEEDDDSDLEKSLLNDVVMMLR